MLPEEGPDPINNNVDNLVGYTHASMCNSTSKHTKLVCTINISKINNVQTLFKCPKFVHLCHRLEFENDVHSSFICHRNYISIVFIFLFSV